MDKFFDFKKAAKELSEFSEAKGTLLEEILVTASMEETSQNDLDDVGEGEEVILEMNEEEKNYLTLRNLYADKFKSTIPPNPKNERDKEEFMEFYQEHRYELDGLALKNNFFSDLLFISIRIRLKKIGKKFAEIGIRKGFKVVSIMKKECSCDPLVALGELISSIFQIKNTENIH